MSGDVLLAGTKQNDGTVKTDESLRLRGMLIYKEAKDVMRRGCFSLRERNRTMERPRKTCPEINGS